MSILLRALIIFVLGGMVMVSAAELRSKRGSYDAKSGGGYDCSAHLEECADQLDACRKSAKADRDSCMWGSLICDTNYRNDLEDCLDDDRGCLPQECSGKGKRKR
jgi:hypothetical protein